jgi:signal transduction histidine kinase
VTGREEARRAGLEFLGTLAGGLVHEIKNPLSTLRINLTLLKEDLLAAHPEERRMERRIEILEKEVGRLDAVLAEFQQYAGLLRPDLRTVDLGSIAAEMAEFVGPGFARDGVTLLVDVEELPVLADAQLLKRALLNVLLNAQQAIEGEGTVRLRAWREGARVRLEVADDGCGIPQADLERVFEVYFSGSKAGSGLGLPTARRILQEHGGDLRLESKRGEGTTVRMWLESA